jgi:4a-hydroxytetrahydrobiopterin dehydratase
MEIPERERLLGEAELAAALASLDGWERDGAAITKRFRFKGFKAAIAFVDRVADVVNRADHHPDIHIEHYKHVRIVLTTHKTKGISQADIDVARAIDALPT